MAKDAREYAYLHQAMKACSFRVFDFFCAGNWYVNADDGWRGYSARLPPKLQVEIRRMTGRLRDMGGVFNIVTGTAGLDEAIKAYEEVYSRSWKRAEPFPRFIPTLAKTFAARGQLRLGIASIEDRPIAAQLWTICGHKASIFKVAYDEEYKALSPGTILTSAIMEFVLTNDGVRTVDFLSGNDDYKKKWMNARRDQQQVANWSRRSNAGSRPSLDEDCISP